MRKLIGRLGLPIVVAVAFLATERSAHSSGSNFLIINVGTGRCLDGFPGVGSNPYTNTCIAGDLYQQWTLTSAGAGYQICNYVTSLCIDAYVAVPGQPYMQTSYPTDFYQQWEQYPRATGFQWRDAGNGACLDGYTGGPAGTYVYLNTCYDTDADQAWTLEGAIP